VNDYNDPDVMFMQMMITHHEAGVIMAAKVLKAGENAEVKNLAQSIVDTQDAEIDKMLAWLAARGLSRKKMPSGGHGMGG
jgi:uncharacterized protein (DUF305 family)